ncbi:bacterial regulatory s, crp family protein [Lapidilactobacillus concavus DSM 17758]|uniref:Bacterial regulatory s, crp family protein n=1 Tax=Lapidilactobacillus concavus DSM 17758 TaxID=1423735 RepID=A0A0R1VSB2_9LACO|nr:Crp/Fnr family transcriptional regulator [Lapidilactobacillus concavus]KRM08341.1 bacterial regulatory s, crp family protein [Lapidilactobacillus concavus DSM 17758]GEL13649.1 Crp/Fnr family transcriptional regulator [Lapidilactobacillus concavus]
MTEHVCAEIVPIFQQLNHDELIKVSSLVKHHHVEKGEVILSPDSPSQLVIIAQGAAKTYQLSANGKEQLLRVLDAGDFEGEKNLFGVGNDELYVEMLKNSTYCSIETTNFQQLLGSYPSIALKLLKSNAEKIDALEKQNQLLNHDLVEQRLATYLLDLAKTKGSYQFILPMKLKELASFLGTTPETISRKLKLFVQQDLLTQNRHQIEITAPDQLEAIKNA